MRPRPSNILNDKKQLDEAAARKLGDAAAAAHTTADAAPFYSGASGNLVGAKSNPAQVYDPDIDAYRDVSPLVFGESFERRLHAVEGDTPIVELTAPLPLEQGALFTPGAPPFNVGLPIPSLRAWSAQFPPVSFDPSVNLPSDGCVTLPLPPANITDGNLLPPSQGDGVLPPAWIRLTNTGAVVVNAINPPVSGDADEGDLELSPLPDYIPDALGNIPPAQLDANGATLTPIRIPLDGTLVIFTQTGSGTTQFVTGQSGTSGGSTAQLVTALGDSPTLGAGNTIAFAWDSTRGWREVWRNMQPGFWAKIIGQATSAPLNVYSFEQVVDSIPPNGWVAPAGGIVGTLNAVEVNGSISVWPGAIVWMYQSETGGWWEFSNQGDAWYGQRGFINTQAQQFGGPKFFDGIGIGYSYAYPCNYSTLFTVTTGQGDVIISTVGNAGSAGLLVNSMPGGYAYGVSGGSQGFVGFLEGLTNNPGVSFFAICQASGLYLSSSYSAVGLGQNGVILFNGSCTQYVPPDVYVANIQAVSGMDSAGTIFLSGWCTVVGSGAGGSSLSTGGVNGGSYW